MRNKRLVDGDPWGVREVEDIRAERCLVTELACTTPKAVYHLRLIQENARISW